MQRIRGDKQAAPAPAPALAQLDDEIPSYIGYCGTVMALAHWASFGQSVTQWITARSNKTSYWILHGCKHWSIAQLPVRRDRVKTVAATHVQIWSCTCRKHPKRTSRRLAWLLSDQYTI